MTYVPNSSNCYYGMVILFEREIRRAGLPLNRNYLLLNEIDPLSKKNPNQSLRLLVFTEDGIYIAEVFVKIFWEIYIQRSRLEFQRISRYTIYDLQTEKKFFTIFISWKCNGSTKTFSFKNCFLFDYNFNRINFQHLKDKNFYHIGEYSPLSYNDEN